MLVYIRVHKNFSHPQVEQGRFQMDVDQTASIEDIKVLITLRYVDLSPEDFDLVSDINNLKMQNKLKVCDIIMQSEDPLNFVMVQKSKKCCCLVF